MTSCDQARPSGPTLEGAIFCCGLMRHAFDIDVLAGPQGGNRMRLLATIEDPRVVEQLLIHPGRPSERVRADPAHVPPAPLVADTPA